MRVLRSWGVVRGILVAVAVGACGGGDGPVTLPPFTVDENGGELAFLDSAVIVRVPVGAVSEPTTFTVTTGGLSAPTLVSGTAVSVTSNPLVTTFNPPITVRFRYDPAGLPGGVQESELGAYRFENNVWTEITSALDVANDTITVTVTQLGSFAVLGAPATQVAVTPVNPAIDIGATVALTATVSDVDGTPLPQRAVTWSSAANGTATVSTAGVVTGVAAGTVAITAAVTAENVQGATNVTVNAAPPPPPPPGDNEPAGYTLITDRDFSTLATCGQAATRIQGWDDTEACSPATASLVTDNSAPRSAGSVYEWRYPQGFVAGSSPGTPQRLIQSLGYRRLYISAWVRLSANWEGHLSATNKMFFVWQDNDPLFFLSAEGQGSAPLVPQLRLQGTLPDARPRLLPNVVPGATIARGTWQRWEVVVECTTPGTANGRARWWIDGVLVSDHQDINWTEAGKSCVWENVQLRPVWGGTGGATTVSMDLRMDHIRISGQP